MNTTYTCWYNRISVVGKKEIGEQSPVFKAVIS